MNPILNNLPITKLKLFIARILFLLIKPVYGTKKRIIKRKGLFFEVDITEGLDLSLFLFGSFQQHVSDNKYLLLPEDAVILDVGANVGIMSLHFARNSPFGKVYAFEPTHYAFEKLERNLHLNFELASRIQIIQTFITSEEKKSNTITAFSSWKVNKKAGGDQHPIHGGKAMSTKGVLTTTIDEFAKKQRIDRIDFIKIDTDGHEFDVLVGGRKTIERLRPRIIFEVGQYIMEEHGITFMNYYHFFERMNYMLSNASNNKPITKENHGKMIPKKGTIDILAVPLK